MTVLRASVKMGVSVLLTMRKGCWSVIGKERWGGLDNFSLSFLFPFLVDYVCLKSNAKRLGKSFRIIPYCQVWWTMWYKVWRRADL